MFLARVVGRVWATAKEPGLEGRKLLLLEPIGPDGKRRGRRLVAVDAVGAGAGEIVYWCRGRESTIPFLPDEVPTDASVVGIVDTISTVKR
ncbi:MAG: EutN/CcmL family microcompartment protein [Acidobacteria bacterium]|nr:EutN/CcmL family microcompartment protein [Acidobacteriota bacterium]